MKAELKIICGVSVSAVMLYFVCTSVIGLVNAIQCQADAWQIRAAFCLYFIAICLYLYYLVMKSVLYDC